MPARKNTSTASVSKTAAKKATARPRAAKAPAALRSYSAELARLSSVHELKRPAPPAHKEIERKAFELWQRRGGDHLANWFEAESILNRERSLAASN